MQWTAKSTIPGTPWNAPTVDLGGVEGLRTNDPDLGYRGISTATVEGHPGSCRKLVTETSHDRFTYLSFVSRV